jgi:hypothetical protein
MKNECIPFIARNNERKTKLSTRNLYKKSSIVFKEIGYLNEKERERRIW